MRKEFSKIMTLLLMVPAICLSLVLSTGTMAWAVEDKQLSENAEDEGMQLLVKAVTLDKKSSEMVRTTKGKKYDINKDTLIVGEDGKQVLIIHLKLPCKAELIYETMADGGRFAHGINVINTQSGATNQMSGKPR